MLKTAVLIAMFVAIGLSDKNVKKRASVLPTTFGDLSQMLVLAIAKCRTPSTLDDKIRCLTLYNKNIAISQYLLLSRLPKPPHPPRPASLFQCDFETNDCSLYRSPSATSYYYFSWKRHRYSSSYGGPSKDHTKGTLGYYMYVPATGRYYSSATFSTPVSLNLPKGTQICIKFYYHMSSSYIGTLTVYVTRSGSSRQRILYYYGYKGNNWYQASTSYTLPVYGRYKLEFIATRKSSYYSYSSSKGGIAIDDITITSGLCSTVTG